MASKAHHTAIKELLRLPSVNLAKASLANDLHQVIARVRIHQWRCAWMGKLRRQQVAVEVASGGEPVGLFCCVTNAFLIPLMREKAQGRRRSLLCQQDLSLARELKLLRQSIVKDIFRLGLC